jgi:hypothetical protein
MYHYKQINDLVSTGSCMIRNYLDIDTADLTEIIKIVEKKIINLEDTERVKRGGYDYFGYVNLDFDFILKFLDEKLIADLSNVCGKKIFLKRIPLYKSLVEKKKNDISFRWHTDREKPLFSLLYYFTDVNKNSAHTKYYKSISIIDNIFGYSDPRNSFWGVLKLKLYQFFSKPVSAYGRKNDLLIINNGYALHKAFIPNTEKFEPRKNLHISMTPNHYNPKEIEKISNFDKLKTYILDKKKNKKLVLNFLSKLI